MSRPTYVKMMSDKSKGIAQGIGLRWIAKENVYWRDAGQWGCKAKTVKGQLISVDMYKGKHPQLDGNKLVPITKKEWADDNKGYI